MFLGWFTVEQLNTQLSQHKFSDYEAQVRRNLEGQKLKANKNTRSYNLISVIEAYIVLLKRVPTLYLLFLKDIPQLFKPELPKTSLSQFII